MDRAGPVPVVATAACVMLFAWGILSLAGWTFLAVIAGVVLLDCALRAAMVANQTLVNTVAPQSRARANTIFGTHVWGGNALGAFFASTAFAHYGWAGVCAVTIVASAAALALALRARAPQRAAQRDRIEQAPGEGDG
jgi:predicted MFS family arabinose efflux permease